MPQKMNKGNGPRRPIFRVFRRIATAFREWRKRGPPSLRPQTEIFIPLSKAGEFAPVVRRLFGDGCRVMIVNVMKPPGISVKNLNFSLSEQQLRDLGIDKHTANEFVELVVNTNGKKNHSVVFYPARRKYWVHDGPHRGLIYDY